MADLPNTTTMGLTEARAQLSTLVNDAFRTSRRVIVEKNGISAAAIISVRTLNVSSCLEQRSGHQAS